MRLIQRVFNQFVFLMLLMVPQLIAGTEKPVAPCYEVHGRLSYWNGAPSTRIWIIGTHRLLGLHDEDSYLPANVTKLLKGDFDDEVFGTFVVCPITKAKAGEMQMVYVKSASRLTYHRRNSD